MNINKKELDIDKLIEEVYNDSKLIKLRKNNIYLSDEQINVLNKYNIDYNKYNSLSSLIFEIEEILNNEVDLFDLEEVSDKLSELNYYNNTNK